jgi:hypothetical protein
MPILLNSLMPGDAATFPSQAARLRFHQPIKFAQSPCLTSRGHFTIALDFDRSHWQDESYAAISMARCGPK